MKATFTFIKSTVRSGSLNRNPFTSSSFAKPNHSSTFLSTPRIFVVVRKMDASTTSNDLVSVSWLAANLSKVKVLDTSWSLGGKPDFHKLYLEKHIPSAQFFDIDKIADVSIPALPHMLPSKELFQESARALGLNNEDHVVVYDASGVYYASARVWWTFRVFGHNKVSVLDGGLAKWIKEGHPVESGAISPVKPGNFQVSSYHPELVENFDSMLQHLDKKTLILDARPKGRFVGVDEEPRPNLHKGHIPGSKNLLHASLLEKQNPSEDILTFLPKDKIKQVFQSAGIDTDSDTPVITSCGSGVAASVLAFGLHLAGHRKYSVYDGSWTEWASVQKNGKAPIATGEEK